MNKQILVIYYSQTGQLGEIVNNFTFPLIEAGHSLEFVKVTCEKSFDFPWSGPRFFDAMPESVLGHSIELDPFVLTKEKYDLVIFAYQPWYLSPSIPATSILNDPSFKQVVKDTPVLTLIGARNMWLNSQEKVKSSLKESGANLVGNVVFTDRNNNHISALTIVYWMMYGKKDRMFGFFPKPGVSEKDIKESSKFGKILNTFLEKGNYNKLQESFVEACAIEVKPDLMFIEEKAGRLFLIWANLIFGKGNRDFKLVMFKYYLIIALFGVAPILVTLNKVMFRPFVRKRVNKKTQYYLGLN